MRVDLAATLVALPRHPRRRRAAVLDFQARRLREVVAHAAAHVPYYARLFAAAGVQAADVQSAADLARVPVTTKNDLRAQSVDDLVTRGVDPERLINHTTSGSTGEPFTMRRTWLEERVMGAFRRRALRDFGMRPTDHLVLVGLSTAPNPRDHQLAQRAASAMGLYRRTLISCMAPPRDVLRAVREARPDVLNGYPGVLTRLADVLETEGGPAPRLRFIVCGGEVLEPDTRRHISERFGTRVFELYASFEFGLIAAECRETGLLHVCEDNVVLEVVRDGQRVPVGERGEAVITSLHARAMPFVRYRLGDVLTRGPERCPCGAPFSTIAVVQGRALDYLTLPGDRLLHPYEIGMRLPRKPGAWMQRYGLIQDVIDRVTLQIVPYRTPTAEELAEVRESLRLLLGPGVELRIDLVEAIADDPSGKRRTSRSAVTVARARR